MKVHVFAALLLCASLAVAQQQQSQAPYQPAVPPPSFGGYGGGGYGGYGGGAGTTVAGSAMTGMANAISAKGSYNLSTSAAAVNMTQAQKNEIENHQLYTNTYFEMRATNKQARAAEDGPPPTAEQLARIAHETAPKPLSAGEMNEVTGKISWPQALQLDLFAADREKLEGVVGNYSQMGNLNYSDQQKARSLINDMAAKLKSQIRSMPSTDYTTCKEFLRSLMFTTAKCQLS
jgi:hypothetical protein